MPTREEYESLQQRVVKDVSTRMGIQVSLAPADQDRLLANLQGLTLAEAEKLLTRVLVEDGRLDADDVKRVVEAKRELVERDGLLEFQPAVQSLDDIADLVHLKEWLGKRRLFMEDRQRAADFGLEFPRGVLLVGVPGCGKSLCAKAVAAAWGLPLVELDPGALYDKYIGETEQNFRKAMASADRLAPLVLWIDEIEKAFAAGGEDADGGDLAAGARARSSPGCRSAAATCSWSPPPTTCSACRPSCCARAGSTRRSSSTCPTKRRAPPILDIHLRRRKQAPERLRPAGCWRARARDTAAPSWSRSWSRRSTPPSRPAGGSDRATCCSTSCAGCRRSPRPPARRSPSCASGPQGRTVPAN